MKGNVARLGSGCPSVGTSAAPCSGHGKCSLGGHTGQNSAPGVCLPSWGPRMDIVTENVRREDDNTGGGCDPGWGGKDCATPTGSLCPLFEVIKKGSTNESAFASSSVLDPAETEMLPCSGHGACMSNAECCCDPGYLGLDCEDAPDNRRHTNCPAGVHPETFEPGRCSTNGECGADGKCVCRLGWLGERCDTRAPLKSGSVDEYHKACPTGNGGDEAPAGVALAACERCIATCER